MDITDRRIWQQAAGDTNRNYVQVCLDNGVILNGPGNRGPYAEAAEAMRREDGLSARKMTGLARFVQEVQSGDLVVLRTGTKEVHAVGEVIGDYEWHQSFGDVDGWDLQHVRRVNWRWIGQEAPQAFDVYALKQGDTTQELTSAAVLEWLAQLEPNAPEPTQGAPVHWGVETSAITIEQVGDRLYERGVSSVNIQRLTGEFDELARIARWYQKFDNPSEHETVAYLVVPLLRALGWTPQRMAIEWNKVDLALFDKLPRDDRSLSVVVEAKKMGNSCLTAQSQAEGYANGKDNCNRLIVTDGLRYGVFLKTNETFKLAAYFNITDLREAYPIYGCGGVNEALELMGAEWRDLS